MARAVAVLMLVLTLGLPSRTVAQAQTSETAPVLVLTPGTRIRVASTAVSRKMTGFLSGATESTLTIVPDGGMPMMIPATSVTSMELSLGRKRNPVKGLVIGVATGIALGLAFPVEPDNCGPDSSNFCARRDAIGGGIIFFGGLGLGVGALVTSERWAPMSLGFATATAAGHPAAMMAVGVRF